MDIHVVGCGGIASYAVPVLAKLLHYRTPRGKMVLQDKDVLEDKNLARQLFNTRDVGVPKAEALAQMLRPFRAATTLSWFSSGQDVTPGAVVFAFVDNHRARSSVLAAVDRADGCTAILAGNAVTSADAYLYRKEWAGTGADPRVRFPELETDMSGDPSAHCNSEETLVETGGQTAVANFQAAQYALQLFTAWFLVEGIEEVRGACPIQIAGNFSKVRVLTLDESMEAVC